jgi:MATE family multidrug resistance protein
MIEQAAHQVAISLASMTYMMASGVSSAAAIRSGNYFGSGNHKELRLSAISNYHIVIVFMSCTAIIFTLFNHVLTMDIYFRYKCYKHCRTATYSCSILSVV